jgi:hypothetical protein
MIIVVVDSKLTIPADSLPAHQPMPDAPHVGVTPPVSP